MLGGFGLRRGDRDVSLFETDFLPRQPNDFLGPNASKGTQGDRGSYVALSNLEQLSELIGRQYSDLFGFHRHPLDRFDRIFRAELFAHAKLEQRMKQGAVGVDRDRAHAEIVQPSLDLIAGHVIDSIRAVGNTKPLEQAAKRVEVLFATPMLDPRFQVNVRHFADSCFWRSASAYVIVDHLDEGDAIAGKSFLGVQGFQP
jgi:hypothetical protein